jgi:hypothetical protein
MFVSFQVGLESIKVLVPEYFVVSQPFLRRPKVASIEAHDLEISSPFTRH